MNNRMRLDNYAFGKEQYMKLVSAKSTLQCYKYMTCCQSDKTLEALRNAAEVALDAFLDQVGNTIFAEERAIAKILDDSQTSIFKKVKSLI